MQISNQKRILKNTIMLYIRMIVIMIVTLYTSRIVLSTLGVDDFGIYNIVGGIVVSLSFVSNTLMSATQRFFSYELGKGDIESVRKVYSMSINIHALFVFVSIVILETLGLWLVNHVLIIPVERRIAADIAYHFTVLTYCINLMRIPYNAMIVAYEEMSIFAILSVVEAILKLLIVYLLLVFSEDKLILYSILFFIITLIINILYLLYCRKKYELVCNYKFENNKKLFKEMIGFSSWNLLGGISGALAGEGPNFFMNIYLGVKLNAAMGIAKQVRTAVYNFTSSFQTAFNPQIVKLYAQNDRERLFDLVFKSSSMSFYLIFVFSLPIILCASRLFSLWLVDVPDFAVTFSVLMIISQFIASLASPLWMLVHATGNIRSYQLTISLLCLLVFPLSWFILEMKWSPIYILVCLIFLDVIIFAYRTIFLKYKIGFPIVDYYKKVVIKSSLLAILATIIPLCISLSYNSFATDLIVFLLAFLISCFVFYYMGLDKLMRQEIKTFVLSKIRRK